MTTRLHEPSEPAGPKDLQDALRARRQRLQRGGHVFAVTLIAVATTGIGLRLPAEWWVPAVGFVALAGLVFRMLNWTCPACGAQLPTRGGRRCRGCGAAIDG